MEHVYLGREPILDRDNSLRAYEILYKDKNQKSNKASRYTSAAVINTILNKFGTRSLLGERRAFVKVDEKFLMHDLIFSIPNEFFIYSLVDTIEMSEKVVERLEQLHLKGHKIAIDDMAISEELFLKYRNILSLISYVKLKLTDTTATTLEVIKDLKTYDLKVVAVNIGTDKEYIAAKELGCDLFQGYFFAEPKILDNLIYEPSQAAILKLYNLLISDTDMDKLTSAFEDNHEITLQLLQFINSGAFHFRNKISSIRQILTLVGRIPLSQWLMLMIYSKSVSKGSEISPIMSMVKNRTELMEKILKAVKPNADKELLSESYFVGVLSLIDTIFCVELEQILKDIQISQVVEDALLKQEGILGEIYLLVQAIETFEIESIMKFQKKYTLGNEVIENIILESMESVNEFENPSKD